MTTDTAAQNPILFNQQAKPNALPLNLFFNKNSEFQNKIPVYKIFLLNYR